MKERVGLFLFGLVFFAAGAFCLYDIQIKTMSYKKTDGIVIEHDVSSSGKGKSYTAIAEYNVNGNKYTAKANLSTNFPPAIGKKVTVKYNPQDSSDGVIDGGLEDILFPYLFLIPGFLIIIFASKIADSLGSKENQKENAVNEGAEKIAEDYMPPETPKIYDKLKIIGYLFLSILFIGFGVASNFAIKLVVGDSFDPVLDADNEAVTMGVVKSWEVKEVSHGNTYKVSVVNYDVDGVTYTIKSSDSSPTSIYLDPVGKKVKIKYDPANPQNAVYNNERGRDIAFWGINFFSLIFIIIGIRYFLKMLFPPKKIYYQQM